jgi:hypothetical protein
MSSSTYELLMKIGGKLDSSYGSALSKATKSFTLLNKATKPVSAGIGSIKGKLVGLAGAAVAGVTLDTVANAATNNEKALAQMNAVLTSTHGAAGMAKNQLTALAAAQQNNTDYTKSATEQAENMLLTFTNIKSKVFPQTLVATENMATAMHTDATSAALTLGKALNDPAAGLTKLTKQGVTFSAAQKKMITAMEKAGNTAGAQKIILAELNKEFGGSAQAAATTLSGQMTKIKNSIIGTGATAFSAITPIALKLLPSVTGAAQQFAGFVQSHAGDITMIAGKIGAAAMRVVGFASKIFAVVGPFIEPIIKDIGQIASNLLPKLGGASGNLQAKVLSLMHGGMDRLKTALDWVASHGDIVRGVIIGIGSAFVVYKAAVMGAKAVTAIQNALQLISAVRTAAVTEGTLAQVAATQTATGAQIGLNAAILANPITWIIVGIVALIAILVVLFNKNKAFHAFVMQMFGAIKAAVGAVVKYVVSRFMAMWPVIKTILSIMKVGFSIEFQAVVGLFQSLWKSASAIFGNIGNIFLNLINLVKNIFTGNWKGAWQNIVNIFANIFGMIVNIAKTPINAVIGLINGAIGGIDKIHISIPKGVPLVGGQTLGFNIPKIPQFANGGIINHRSGGILANIGEGRYDEAVVPLNGKSLGGGGGDIHITYAPKIIIQGNASKSDVDKALAESQAEFDRKMERWKKEKGRRSSKGKPVF